MLEIAGFTERYVNSLKAKPGQAQSDYADTNPKSRGLGVRVGRTGRRTWFYLYSWGGTRVRVTFGTFPAVSLAEARRRAHEARGCLDAVPPVDPRDYFARKSAAVDTVENLAEDYLAHVEERGLRTAKKIARMFRKDLIPEIGQITLAALHRRDVARVLDRMVERDAKIGAVRLWTMMHGFFKWATSRGDFEHNPIEKMERPAFQERQRDRVLSGPEIRTLWRDALSDDPSHARILKLCLVTAARVGEVSGMAKAELDLAAKTWTIPAERSKNKHAHELPLSSLALEIINEALADSGRSPYVFPSPTSNGPISANATGLAVIVLREELGMAHWTAHDLRRTAADQMADLEVSQLVIGWILNHRSVTRATVTSRHYLPRTYDREMREALDKWAVRVRELVA